MAQSESAIFLAVMDETAKTVAAYTGIKRQLTDSGWSDVNAELMVIEMIRASNPGR